MTLATINAIWIGSRLGELHVACLRSFLRHGHRVVLHVYDEPQDTPFGVELADASKFLPRSRIFKNQKKGLDTFSAFSDLLRYEILRAGLGGVYVDCDVYCLKPFQDADYIVGWEKDQQVNNAVLKLPSDCPALADLCAIKDVKNFIPPWYSFRRKLRYRAIQLLLGGRLPLERLPHPVLGPPMVTYYLRKHNLLSKVQPLDVFYPVSFYQTRLLLDPGLRIEDVVTPRTVSIHLYDRPEFWRPGEPPPAGSILDRIIKETA